MYKDNINAYNLKNYFFTKIAFEIFLETSENLIKSKKVGNLVVPR